MTDKEYQHLLDLMEKGIRADERTKVLEWITNTSRITSDEGEWYVYDTEAQEWHHTDAEELLELYDEQLKGGGEIG